MIASIQLTHRHNNSIFYSQFRLPRQHHNWKICVILKVLAPTEMQSTLLTLEFTFLLKHTISSSSRHQHKAFRGTTLALQITLHHINSLLSSQFRLPGQQRSSNLCVIDKEWAPTLRSDHLQLGQDRQYPAGICLLGLRTLLRVTCPFEMTTGMNRVSEMVGVLGHVWLIYKSPSFVIDWYGHCDVPDFRMETKRSCV